MGGSGGAGVCVPGASEACYSGPSGTDGVGVCLSGTHVCDAAGAGFGPCVAEVLPSVEDCATPEDEDCDGFAPPCPVPPLYGALFGDAQAQTATSIAIDAADNWLITGNGDGSIDFGGGPLVSGAVQGVYVTKRDPTGGFVWAKTFADPGTVSQYARAVSVDGSGNVVVLGDFTGSADFGAGSVAAPSAPALFLVKLDPSGNVMFAKTFAYGDSTVDGSWDSLALSPTGEIVIAGSFLGTAQLGGAVLNSAGQSDIYVARFDAQGNPLWSKALGGAGSDRSGGVGVDSLGQVVLTGCFTGTSDFGGGPLTSFPGSGSKALDVYVAKLDAQGNHLWSKSYPTPDVQLGGPVHVGPGDVIVFAGAALGAFDLGGGPIQGAAAGACYAAELTADGAYVWSKTFGCSYEQIGSSVTADIGGNVIVSGFFQNTSDFGAGPVVAQGRDAFVMKLDVTGLPLWSRVYGGPGLWDKAHDAATDSAGAVVVVGAVEGGADLGGGLVPSQGGYDAFLVKLAP